MKRNLIDEALRATLEDHQLTRSEKRALKALLADFTLDEQALGLLRRRAFEMARAELAGKESHDVLAWLEEVVKVIGAAAAPPPPRFAAEAYFTGEDDMALRVRKLFQRCRRRADVCVFTITDDFITSAILSAHERGVAIRVISDDDKVYDLGNDVGALQRAGVPVRLDRSEAHMHHKFALFDATTLLTGSYNWTKGAARDNQENILVTDDERLVAAYYDEFERLWERYGP